MSSTKVPFFWKNLCALLIFSPPKLKIPSPPLHSHISWSFVEQCSQFPKEVTFPVFPKTSIENSWIQKKFYDHFSVGLHSSPFPKPGVACPNFFERVTTRLSDWRRSNFQFWRSCYRSSKSQKIKGT